MKYKIYYQFIVTTNEGTTFENLLLPSELHLIATLLKDHKKVEVTKVKIDIDTYKLIFNQ
jgi:hypothetical protein